MSGVRVPPPALESLTETAPSRAAGHSSSARRRVVLLALGFLAALLVITAFVLRPAPLLGLDAEALQQSVGGVLGGGHCEVLGDGTWDCIRQEGGLFADESVPYRVEVDGLGCWQATQTGVPREGPERFAGCVTLVDYILG